MTARRWIQRVAGLGVVGGAIARIIGVHRRAVKEEGALLAEQVTRLRRSPPDAVRAPRAGLAVQRHRGSIEVRLSPFAEADTALVDPTALPVAHGRADALRAEGVVESTLHADAVFRELRRVARTGGAIVVEVANAAAAREAVTRGDVLGVLRRARAARGHTQLAGRRLLRSHDNGSMSVELPVTHSELIDLARAAGIEPDSKDVRSPLPRALGRQVRLRGRAAPAPGRPVQPWWPPLLRSDVTFEYLGPRSEVAALVPEGSARVLDLGCAAGSLGGLLERRGMRVTGIELDPTLAALAERAVTKVIKGDIIDVLASGNDLDPHGYDVIVAADCLEHLTDPDAALRLAVKRLTGNGCVIVSIPNVRHWDTLWNLGLRGVWPQRTSGIHDRTHLRWFTRRSVIELLEGAGLRVEVLDSVRRVHEARPSWLDRPARLLGGSLGELVTFQWLARARSETG